MFLTPLLVQKLGLIENLSKREIENPEGVGIDVRVGEVYRMKGDCFLEGEQGKRKMPEVEKIADINDESTPRKIKMKPGEYFLVTTMESVNIPGEKIVTHKGGEPIYIMQDVRPRSTLQRCGIIFIGTKTDPGYHGKLTYAIYNAGGLNFSFELGARFANLIFMEVRGEIARSYEGQHQGGRVSSDGKTETQK